MLPSSVMKTKLGAAAASNPEADNPVEEDPELFEEEEDPEIYEEEEDPEEEIEGEWEEVEEEIEEEVDDDDEDEERVPEPVKQKQKLREFEVFVGGLLREAVEEDLTIKKAFTDVVEEVKGGEVSLAEFVVEDACRDLEQEMT